MNDRIAMIDRLAHYLCRKDGWSIDGAQEMSPAEERRWTRDIEKYRARARQILDEVDGWKSA